MCAAASTVQILTPAGRGAVATLRVEGLAAIDEPPPLFVAANGRQVRQQEINRICFGRWGHDAAEDVVVCRVSDDHAELHCHGGDAAVARIVADLELRGCMRRSGQPETWTSMTFDEPGEPHPPLAGDLIEAECRGALTRATTMRTAEILWQQCEGRLAAAFAELDTLPAAEAKRQAAEMLRWARFGRHLSEPWQVVLCGRPNVGKSSLINALVGYGRSIVFDQPGTTRDVVTVETALDGWPIAFSDTAGLREDADELESAGIARARQRLASADLRILLLDISRPPHDDDHRLLAEWPDALIVAHKCDLPCRWGLLPQDAKLVSSLTGSGVDEMAAEIVARLVPVTPEPLTGIPVTPRQFDLLRGIASTQDRQ